MKNSFSKLFVSFSSIFLVLSRWKDQYDYTMCMLLLLMLGG